MPAPNESGAKPPPPAAGAKAPAGPAKASPLQAWLPLILALVLMPALGFATMNFMLLPKLKQQLAQPPAGGEEAAAAEPEAKPAAAHGAKPDEKAGHGAKAPAKGAKEMVVMSKLMVNVSGSMGSRLLMVSLTMAGTGSDFKARVDQNEAQLRDTACSILQTKTLADLEKPGTRTLLRSELHNAFNGILGESRLQEIFIPEFVVQ